MRIRLAQCLCGPKRHGIVALGINDPAMTDAKAIELMKAAADALLEGKGIEVGLPIPSCPPWCGICGAPSSEWTYEVGWSVQYSDWDTAQKELRKVEADNYISAVVLDVFEESFNARTRNEIKRNVNEAEKKKA